MKRFNSIEEMKPYLHKNTGTFEFIEDGKPIDIEIAFDLDLHSNIKAGDIKAGDIRAFNITGHNISVRDINVFDINAWHINARNISSGKIRP
jgi:hypothetical protein